MGKKIKNWANYACIGTCSNAVAEPVVSDTFTIIQAFDNISVANNVTVSLDNKNMQVADGGDYSVSISLRVNSASKTFIYAIFINGVESILAPTDKSEGHVSVPNAIITLQAGDVVDIRQRSTDGGTYLLVTSATFSLVRLS